MSSYSEKLSPVDHSPQVASFAGELSMYPINLQEYAAFDEVPSAQQITERLERDHAVKHMPRLADQVNDLSRTNKIVYLSGRQTADHWRSSNPKYKGNHATVTEHEGLRGLATFMSEALSQGTHGVFNPYDLRALRSVSENLSYLGEKEMIEASRGIADYWKTILDNDPSLTICIVNGYFRSHHDELVEPYKDPTLEDLEPPHIKSDEFVVEKVLEHFSEQELEKYYDRLLLNVEDIDPEDENTRLIFVDDWTISGGYLRRIHQFLSLNYPMLVDKLECQLLVASEDRIENGLRSTYTIIAGQNGHGRTLSTNIPIRSYYVAHHAPDLVDEVVISGSHSSVDFGFDNLFSNVALSAQHLPKDEAKRLGLSEMPPLTNIVRQYRNTSLPRTEKLRD